MSTPKALEILKSALLLELRGKAFYEKAADSAEDKDVKDFFVKLAEDEISHVQILSEQYKSYKKDGTFVEMDRNVSNESVANAVLTDSLKERIAGAGFESAAISAAMGMEERAIKLYSQRADESTDPQEKALYGWLAEWETQHLEFLAAIDKEVTEALWNDNSFWPF
ncbi:MAG: ferritin family protein [Desulfobacterales bacterium]|nr:ferritin family protein [Desulfobacterales bacterium]MDX2511341.1 ferritin family protein [Desulfobacterales bacterium]